MYAVQPNNDLITNKNYIEPGYLSKNDLFLLLKSSLRPAIAKAMPFGKRGQNNEPATPAATPRGVTSSAGQNDEEKDIDMDIDEETKPGFLQL